MAPPAVPCRCFGAQAPLLASPYMNGARALCKQVVTQRVVLNSLPWALSCGSAPGRLQLQCLEVYSQARLLLTTAACTARLRAVCALAQQGGNLDRRAPAPAWLCRSSDALA